jgi:hypothetical protein
MKKAVILVMSCEQERYKNEEEIIRKTWAKDILDDKYENLKLLFYRGGSDDIREHDNILLLKNNDDLEGTFEKTREAFLYVKDHFEYDYIIRTNTSTYVNVQNILSFLEFNDIDEETMYGTALCISDSDCFLRGCFLIIPSKMVDIICGYSFSNVDDIGFSRIIMKKYNEDIFSHIREIDGVNNISEPYYDKLSSTYMVRVKDENNPENNIVTMLGLHTLFKNIKQFNATSPHNFTHVETKFGKIPI